MVLVGVHCVCWEINRNMKLLLLYFFVINVIKCSSQNDKINTLPNIIIMLMDDVCIFTSSKLFVLYNFHEYIYNILLLYVSKKYNLIKQRCCVDFYK